MESGLVRESLQTQITNSNQIKRKSRYENGHDLKLRGFRGVGVTKDGRNVVVVSVSQTARLEPLASLNERGHDSSGKVTNQTLNRFVQLFCKGTVDPKISAGFSSDDQRPSASLSTYPERTSAEKPANIPEKVRC